MPVMDKMQIAEPRKSITAFDGWTITDEDKWNDNYHFYPEHANDMKGDDRIWVKR